jgi:uncharacterized protein YjiS (DUF1127 family)
MRYHDARRCGGRESVWLRFRLAFATAARWRNPAPPLADLTRLDDHLLKDIGLFGSERRMAPPEFRRPVR